ncbi:hypothetical protein SYNTR_1251 [Candidatus Syntrophocurvum alkaliphilum]|uniref:Putative regulatory protein FmdB zinc ribbon domain-containing protein n=1 Tax=Candidatus Syntrophocurvum alkaliphilum TaxID=2293317 RepID=A0A6I6DJ56_9FIRM|nr:zinc ribbon domain-containing protein [Candidatus Syntrophocurvum alkaliphilum]QGT99844.1 hypothetical protein SYNTR_1251 [Candidatus Syntrophocurvum alkaliphilum]
MPIFDFQCKECDHKFDLMISNNDKDKAKCPKCKTTNVKQLLSLFNTGSSNKPSNNNNNSCHGCSAAGTGG